MEIRKAQTGDIPGLISLLQQIGQFHYELRPDIFRPVAQKYDEAALEKMLSDEQKVVFVAAEGDAVLGYCMCAIRFYQNSSTVADHEELYIDDLCVDENHRREGIAAALYRHVLGYAKEQGCQFLSLNVWCGNDGAMAFYEKMGMRPRRIVMETPLEEVSC